MNTAKVVPLQAPQHRPAGGPHGGNLNSSHALIRLIEHSIAEGQIARRDVLRAVCDTFYHPDWVRLDFEHWLGETGITGAIGVATQPLPRCPFSTEELRAADENGEIPVAMPAGLRREHLAAAFGIKHWAISEANVSSMEAGKPVWLLVSAREGLSFVGKSCTDAVAAAEKTGHTGLSLEEYVVFAQRYRYLTGRAPDSVDWTWLPRSAYATSLVPCGGFPAQNDIFVNVWPWAEFQGNIGMRLARRVEA